MSKKAKPVSIPGASVQLLFQQASSLHQQGLLAKAEAAYNQIISVDPQHVDALHLLGVLAAQTQRAEMGVRLIEQAIAIKPKHHALHSNLGNSLMVLSRFEAAAQAYAQAIALKPDFEQAHFNLGSAYKALHRLEDACACFEKALLIQPHLVQARVSLGHAVAALGHHAVAIEHFNTAIALRPTFTEAFLGLVASFQALRQYEPALSALAHALSIDPNNAAVHEQRGNILRDVGLLNESRASLEEALRLTPNSANTWNSLGVTHYELGQLPEALRCYRAAIAADPLHLHAHTNLLFALSVSPDVTPHQYLEQVLGYKKVLSDKVQAPHTSWKVQPVNANNPLRIGLVSGDLNHHPVGFFLEGLLKHAKAHPIEYWVYATHDKEDALTARLKSHVHTWRSVQGLAGQAAARQIHDDGVHVLIDLAGHTGDNMLEIFAWHPAPVQISWLGYFASTGVPHMDWVMADLACVPLGDENQFTEGVLRLPHSRLCFTPPTQAPDIAPLPAQTHGHITFGSFQPLAKLHDGVLSLWARVMQAVPSARLRLQNRALSQASYREALLARLHHAGIDTTRVDLKEPGEYQTYLRAHAEVDIILDSFPFAGGTTTCDALWMGVPTLTLQGTTMASRQGGAIMSMAHLPDWVAPDQDAFVALAVAKAQDIQALAKLRVNMRTLVAHSPMFDAAQFAADWVGTIEQLWATLSPSLNLIQSPQPN